MAWEQVGNPDGDSVLLANIAATPQEQQRIQTMGAVQQGYVYVRRFIDRSTGSERVEFAVGNPAYGGRWEVLRDTSLAAGTPGQPLPGSPVGTSFPAPGDTKQQIDDYINSVYSLVGTSLTAKEGVDLVKSFMGKIAGKDAQRAHSTSIINNMLALAPKVKPEEADNFSKGLAAMMFAGGIFGDFSGGGSVSPAGFAGSYAPQFTADRVDSTLAAAAPGPVVSSAPNLGGYGGGGLARPPAAAPVPTVSAQTQPGASMGPPPDFTSVSAQTQPGAQWGEREALEDVDVAARGLESGPLMQQLNRILIPNGTAEEPD